MPDQSVLLDQVRRHWEYVTKDVDRAHKIYHDDAVLEFPQSGEQFEALENSGSGVGSPLLTSRSTPAGSLTVVIWWW